jgi:hypothetical protein
MKLTQKQFNEFTYADVIDGDVLLYGGNRNNHMLRTVFTNVGDLEAALKRPLIICREEDAMSLHSVESFIRDIVEYLGEESYLESMDYIDQIAIKLDQTHAQIYGLILNDFRHWLEDNPIWMQSKMTKTNLIALELHSKPPSLGL